jgi:NADP-dependent 3-hydroxy acid dehydrogenase YdfG
MAGNVTGAGGGVGQERARERAERGAKGTRVELTNACHGSACGDAS